MSVTEKYKISVIVPVYNVEGYIKRNIESIISQNIHMEIIYVDDGSTDKSAGIIRKYMETDDRIKLFQKENGGIGAARNYGLQQASGKYVIFIDSDDYIEKNSLEVLFDTAEEYKLDIVQACYRRVDDKGNNISGGDGSVNAGGCLSGSQWLIEKKLIVLVCIYLIKREHLIKNNLWFYEDIYHEDVEYTPRLIYYADKIKAIDLCFYNYVQREGSFMHSSSIRKCKDLVKIGDRYKDFAADIIDKETQADIYDFFEKYLRYAYVSSLNSAVMQGIPLGELLKDKELRNKLIIEISQSKNVKHKFLSYIIKFRLYGIYEFLYHINKHFYGWEGISI